MLWKTSSSSQDSVYSACYPDARGNDGASIDRTRPHRNRRIPIRPKTDARNDLFSDLQYSEQLSKPSLQQLDT
jgi:hypothetical protein